MGGTRPPSPEPAILRARARGEVSADQSFERIHALYAPAVRAFVALRVRGPEADDVAQDVWTIFYQRWRRWEHRPEMEAEDAKPVLSFLYRTCQFAVMGHRRKAVPSAELDEATAPRTSVDEPWREWEAGRCLALARRVLADDELDVLLAKLAGVPAREIARALGVTESVVDHKFRRGLGRLRARLGPKPSPRRARHA
jgi:DNA-directed RNA polymerase specialized sigma24 family protein